MTKPPKKTAAEKKGEYRRGTQKKTPKGPSARGAAARAANDKRGVPSVAKPKPPRERSVRDAESRDTAPRDTAPREKPVRDRSGAGSSKRRVKPQRSADAPPSKAGGTVKADREGPMRVQRALARAGVVSRRGADQAVAEGRVQVNGAIATVGQVVDPFRDVIVLDGTPVITRVTSHTWIVVHKPAAVMTTRKDPEGRTTVFDLVDDVPGLVYVGRLDFMTEGVLLLTTDGRAAHALTHPSNEVERTYVATVRGDAVTAAKVARRGVQLEDGLVVPREVVAHPLGGRRWALEITIAEGKTHEVRRLCDALELEVERLVRTRFGPVRLGDLPPGGARALNSTEREVLEALMVGGK
ncbi:pseudouridine synthase [Gemmatimonas sp.]|uniref:pseudouridine synthase n=1 Tax=Gemmatimonas sp. TaxID=1962908 RepID=UPI00286E1068|nr:pseudouridine synthase [Gemmatimonas sp.]